MKIGDRIYYTGDACNSSDWGTVHSLSGYGAILLMDSDEKKFPISKSHVGDVYRGHCNPRFVTKEAFDKYQEEQRASFEKFFGKFKTTQEG